MSRPSPAQPRPSPPSVGRLTDRAEAIQDLWRNGGEPDAEAVLADDPELAAARPLALELAYEEFCLREEAGRPPDPHEFAGRFPFRTSLLRLIDLHGLFDRHSVLTPVHRPAVRYHPGDHLGEFEVVRPLGSGGFADVYLARDLSAGRRGVVLKVAAGNAAEANTLGPLAHPHLMPVLSAPVVGRDRVVVMPFYGVHTLDALIAANAHRRFRTADDLTRFLSAGYTPDDPAALPSPAPAVRPTDPYLTAAVGIAGGLAKALAYLHSRGVAHRDVKPANVLLGDTGHPYLLDFNLSGGHATDGRVGGTLPYLAPELLRGLTDNEPADACDRAAADVYSFGVTAWQLLVGEHPYWSDAPPSGVERLVLAERLGDRQRAFRPDCRPRPSGVPKPALGLVARCLSADPSARPTAAECVEVLYPRRRRWPRWVAVGAFAVALAAGGWAAAQTLAPPADVLPTDPYERGVYLHDRREYAFAAMAFEESARQRQSGHHYACAAYCFALAGQDRTALLRSTQAQQNGYTDPAIHQLDAYCQWILGERERAKISLQLALARLPNDPGVQLLRGLVELSEARQESRPVDRQLVADVRRAVENRGPVAAKAWLVLVRLTLAISNGEPTDRDAAVEMIRNGMRTGLSREEVEQHHSVVAALKSHPLYEGALSEPAIPDSPDVHPYLVCPIHIPAH